MNMLRSLASSPEHSSDADQIHQINKLAFEGPAEADLVDRLRESCPGFVSLVARSDGRAVGHIAFSPVVLRSSDRQHPGMGLAPMSVVPDLQRQGIGSQLVQAGLDELRKRGVQFVVVLGHPDYYPRFGFTPSAPLGIKCEFGDVPAEAFMVLPLDQDMSLESGLIQYHSEFDVFK
jgi:putative acetyltransferase